MVKKKGEKEEEGGNSMLTLQDWEELQCFLENTHLMKPSCN